MLRTILVGLDGSEHGDSALGQAITLAKKFDALLVGMGCVDEPGVHGLEEYLVGEAYFQPINTALLAEIRRKVEGAVSRAALRCADAGVAFKPLEDVGTPYDQILLEAQRFDLIVLGQHTHFQFGWETVPDLTLSKVLADSPRPVIIVPDDHLDREGVVIAYDGSLQASRAVAAFVATGIGKGQAIHVVSVSGEKKDAARRADRAVEFLKSHQHDATAHVVETDRSPAEVILEVIASREAGLLVMGAYGQPVLREFFLGSTTRQMMEKSRTPMFLYH